MSLTKVLAAIVILMGIILTLRLAGFFAVSHPASPPDSTLVSPYPAVVPEPTQTPSIEDQSKIAFVSTREAGTKYNEYDRLVNQYVSDIFTMNSDGSNQIKIATISDSIQDLSWSPDGSKIRFGFYSGDNDGYEIYVMNADGSNQGRLANIGWNTMISPSWSPDGSKIAFISDRAGSDGIYIMHADGSNQTRLQSISSPFSAPAWSPDGKRILFTSSDNGQDERIYVMNADGSNKTTLPVVNSYRNSDPAWSPDGGKIVFIESVPYPVHYSSDIYVMNADGSNQIRLTKYDADFFSSLTWSPDGKEIAFIRSRGNLYLMNADGSDQTDLGACYHYVWSPDGGKIAYIIRGHGWGEYGLLDIYVMNADGSNSTRLTDNAANNSSPAWRPEHLQSSTVGTSPK